MLPSSHCHPSKKKIDVLLWSCIIVITLSVLISLGHFPLPYVTIMANQMVALLKQTWWGIGIGIWSVGFLSSLPRDFITLLLGSPKKPIAGIFRAVCAGVVLDVCNHGVLMIAAQLYKKGITKAQMIAFLVATPWNSFSLLLILGNLQGFSLTLIFLLLSLIIACNTGLAIHWMSKHNNALAEKEEESHQASPPPDGLHFWSLLKPSLRASNLFWHSWINGLREGSMILRWLFLGLIFAAAIRAFVPLTFFQEWLAPSLIGLLITLLFATVIEACSEGSVPIAADITVRAKAPGNAFTFLMAGVATDSTEIIILKQITGRWLLSIIMPALVLLQVLPIAFLLNNAG